MSNTARSMSWPDQPIEVTPADDRPLLDGVMAGYSARLDIGTLLNAIEALP